MKRFKDFIRSKKIKILVEVPENLLPRPSEELQESKRERVGKYTARRDQPHFQGDAYHGHADIPGGYEVSWNKSGSRRHPNKFPATVPADAKKAVAKVLGVSPDILEGYKIFDETVGEEVLLLEVKGS